MIEALSLSKRFGSVRALDRVDLQIAQGASIAIMGPNGSGKSTLLRLIAGLARPTSGEVAIEAAAPRSMKASIGYLGHDHCLYPFLTVTENLVFYCDLYRVDHSRAQTLIDALDLRRKASTAVRELSRGFAQRVAIARTLLHEPRYLLLDEPFNALDGSTAKLIPSIIKAPGRTLLLVTHDEAKASTVTDEVIRMDSGKVL